MEKSNKESLIIQTLSQKAEIKQNVYDITLNVFNELKDILKELTKKYNNQLKHVDNRIFLEYKDNGKFEAELKVAGDLLVFSMHSNIFEFDRNHKIWLLPYVKENILNSYCGIINVYNFLADSFKYSRLDDLGYLVSRIFVNKENAFFVEGKRQTDFFYSTFGKEKINKEMLKEIIDAAILYSIEFDLLVPPYDQVKIANVAQMNKRIEKSKVATGKRLGFKFNSDDVTQEEI